MRKSQFIFVLMLGCSLATMAKADTSYDNCVAAVGAANAANCVPIGDSGTYYALSGAANNQTMTIYGTTGDGSAASVPDFAFQPNGEPSTFPDGVTSLQASGNVDIGNKAFYGATGLTSANLTGVQTIESGAFLRATDLTSVVISDSLLDAEGNILQYAKRDGVYTGINPSAFNGSGLNTIYCPTDRTCGNSFTGLSGTLKIIPYSIDENGQIKAGGKTYASLNDLASGNHIVKRIYTIDEANAVAGKVNSVKIRYR